MKAAPHVLGEKKRKKERGGLCPDASRCGKMFVASRKVWLVRDRCEEHLSAVDLGQTHMGRFVALMPDALPRWRCEGVNELQSEDE